MKVLLVQPPIEDFYDTSIRTYPLSLLYIATKIKDICDVSIVDFRSNRKQRAIAKSFPELASYYRSDRYTPLSLFKRYSRFGADRFQIKQKIALEKPDVVAVSSLFSAYSEVAIDVACCTKEVSQEITTVLEEVHLSSFPKVLQSSFVDYVVRGEEKGLSFILLSH